MGLFGSSGKKGKDAASVGLISQSSEQTKLMTNTTGAPGIQDNNGRSSSATKLLRRASGSFHDSSFGHNPSHSARKSLRLTIRPSTKKDNDDVIATMKHLPDLILDLETAVETSAQRPARSLHMLFALSEYGHNDNRIEMVRHRNSAIDCDNQDDRQVCDGKLVPTLLAFLRRCKTTSQEYRMTLLVLNNISIPMENKRVIALDYGGAKLLAKHLCEDPSCHLVAIILVNLTFAGMNLRKDLVSEDSGIALVESLAFALRLSSLTHEEHEARKLTIEECKSDELHSFADRLSILMAEDQRLRPHRNLLSFGRTSQTIPIPLGSSQPLYPETARWCLTAMKNLTRPCNDATAAHILIKSGTYSLILQYIAVVETSSPQIPDSGFRANSTSPSSSDSSQVNEADPLGQDVVVNDPSNWDSNSVQDTALSIVINLAACPASRELMHEGDTVKVLSNIAHSPTLVAEAKSAKTFDQKQQMDLQCLKARMALAYLIGSQGHFGQSKLRSSASTVNSNVGHSDLTMTESNIKILLELLTNSMYLRRKDGPGGYSSASFSLKYVLFALRCLLTQTSNQMAVAKLVGHEINILLMKVLSQHTMDESVNNFVDAESAEYACFSLYLQSNYGFQDTPFLPIVYSAPTQVDEEDGMENRKDLAAKILVSYLELSNVRPAGRHAAEQLLLRLIHLNYADQKPEVISTKLPFLWSTDLEIDADTLQKLSMVSVGERIHGAKPCDDIFHRSILRSRMPRNGVESKAPWSNMATVSIFASALQAVQQLSYGSTKVRHTDPIDDIQIANNIANSANGERTESYNFLWTWEDKASEIQRKLERQTSVEGNNPTLFSRFSRSSESGNKETGSGMFGFDGCSMCAMDTTSI